MKKASIWYSLHKDHVDKLVSNAKTGYPPTDSLDIKNPNLWKAGHWKWYLDNPILLLED